MASIASIVALLSYSHYFYAGYSVPKLIVIAIGAMILSLGGIDLGKKLAGPALAFMCAATLSASQAGDPWLSFIGQYNAFSIGLMGMMLALMFYLCSSDSPAFPTVISIVAVVVGLHAVAQWGGLLPKPWHGRAHSVMGHPVDMGLFLAMSLPFALNKSKVWAIPIVLGLAVSGSRGACLAGMAGVLMGRECET